MRFLVDECVGPKTASWLRSQGYEVFSVFDSNRGADDEWIMKKCFEVRCVLLTNDKEFGDKVFRERARHKGVILLRLKDERPLSMIKVLSHLLRYHSSRLTDSFVVVTEKHVRSAQR